MLVFKEDWTQNEEHPIHYKERRLNYNRLHRVEPIHIVTKKTKKKNEGKEKKQFLIYSTVVFVQHDEFVWLPLVIDDEIMK